MRNLDSKGWAVLVGLAGCAAPEPIDTQLRLTSQLNGPQAALSLATGQIVAGASYAAQPAGTDLLLVARFGVSFTTWGGRSLCIVGTFDDVSEIPTVVESCDRTMVPLGSNLDDRVGHATGTGLLAHDGDGRRYQLLIVDDVRETTTTTMTIDLRSVD
jgi:hypothetical protein